LVVECRERALGWEEVFQHQLRWARTIRFCRPGAYFFSLLGNATLWPLLFWMFGQTGGVWISLVPESLVVPGYYPPQLFLSWAGLGLAVCGLFRILSAVALQARFTGSLNHMPWWWMVLVKDLLQTILWILSYAGREVVWRGNRFRLYAQGRMEPQD
jgi:ceramide glucosyltransferase